MISNTDCRNNQYSISDYLVFSKSKYLSSYNCNIVLKYTYFLIFKKSIWPFSSSVSTIPCLLFLFLSSLAVIFCFHLLYHLHSCYYFPFFSKLVFILFIFSSSFCFFLLLSPSLIFLCLCPYWTEAVLQFLIFQLFWGCFGFFLQL